MKVTLTTHPDVLDLANSQDNSSEVPPSPTSVLSTSLEEFSKQGCASPVSPLDVPFTEDNASPQFSDHDPDIEDHYVAFHIIEDGSTNPSPQKLLLPTEAEPMNLDVMPPFDTHMLEALEYVAAGDSGPSTEADGSHQGPREDFAAKVPGNDAGPGNDADSSHQGPNEGRSLQDIPEMEVDA